MANVKISDLPAGTAALTDIVPAMDSSGTTTSKLTLSAILDLLVDAAPGALDTLNELAAAIADDATFYDRVPTGHWPSETSNSGKLLTTNGDGSDSALSWTNTLAASLITSGTFDIARLPTGTTSSDVCIGNDARLSDARTPVAHAASLVTSGTFDIARIPTGTTSSDVCIGDDARLSDARTPVAHAASLVTSGTFDIARIPTGTSSSTVCVGNDSRLSDARTPTDHDAAKVTSGTFDIARIPTITQAKLPSTAVVSDTSTEANSAEIDNVVSISQANYNSLVSAGTTNATTLYVIT
jgi:hypothetical protein